MTTNHEALKKSFVIAGTIIFSISASWLALGIHINFSSSVPGLFWYSKKFKSPGDRGEYVYICPDKNFVDDYKINIYVKHRGVCGGIVPLLKRIVAIKGDRVDVDKNGIFVNGNFIRNSQPFVVDGKGNHLPKQSFHGVIPLGHLLVVGDTATSFDSRYFGLVKEKWITATAEHIF